MSVVSRFLRGLFTFASATLDNPLVIAAGTTYLNSITPGLGAVLFSSIDELQASVKGTVEKDGKLSETLPPVVVPFTVNGEDYVIKGQVQKLTDKP